MEILFEDNDILVCIKPIGIVSQSDEKCESMINLLEAHTGGTVYPLHRLDREVGGVMVYAKSHFAAATLSKDIAEHKFKKEYMALVHGKPEFDKGEMRDLLFKDSRKNKSYVVKRMRKGVKEALLEYEVINQKDGLSLVKVLLHTGRTHQIRVQFASRKMSLVGDRKYGADDDFKNIGLWSYRITFNHPKTKEKLEFEKIPENFMGEYLQ
jgi:23S rRNA pseudouridine1911/1915/1917 synthase